MGRYSVCVCHREDNRAQWVKMSSRSKPFSKMNKQEFHVKRLPFVVPFYKQLKAIASKANESDIVCVHFHVCFRNCKCNYS